MNECCEPASPALNEAVGQPTILLADDEEMVRRFVRGVLETRGYHVLEASHGEEAFRVCTEYPGTIDLLLTDLLMPGMGGMGLADRVTRLRPETRVLYISAYSNSDLLPGALALSRTALLRKPFRVADLVDAVAQALA
jgi:two-component system, cell cycle sensor histidine kinase and response regulator CckA